MATKIPISDRPVPEGRRLAGGVGKRKSKYAGKNPNDVRGAGKRLGELEKSREKLGLLFEEFLKFLTDKTLVENKSIKDQDHQKVVLDSIPKVAAELDSRNVGEGSQVVYSACLNSILVQRNEINRIRFQNHFLNKVVKEQKDELEKVKLELEKLKEKNDS